MSTNIKTITIAELKTILDELESNPFPLEFDERDKMHELHQLKHDLNWCWDTNSKALIRCLDFTEYVQEMLYEIGDIRKGGVCDNLVDWDKAAELVEIDYQAVTYDQERYWVRK